MNEFKLLTDGNKKAVQVTIEIPEGFCWEDVGYRMLSFGNHYINQRIVDAYPTGTDSRMEESE